MQVSDQKASKGSRGDKSTGKGEDSAAPAFTIKPVEMRRNRNEQKIGAHLERINEEPESFHNESDSFRDR